MTLPVTTIYGRAIALNTPQAQAFLEETNNRPLPTDVLISFKTVARRHLMLFDLNNAQGFTAEESAALKRKGGPVAMTVAGDCTGKVGRIHVTKVYKP